MSEQTVRSLLWFAAGLGVGAAVGLVIAPQPGVETRRHLAGNAGDYLDRGRELYERGRHLAEEAAQLFDEGRRLMHDADEAVEDRV